MGLKLEEVAEIIYNINRFYSEVMERDVGLAYEYQSELFKKSLEHAIAKEIVFPSEMKEEYFIKSHDRWMEEKTKQGWTYGQKKDFEKKTHPCMAPYEKLDDVDKFRDVLFIKCVQILRVYIKEE